MKDVFHFLKSNNIEYILHEHPAVFTTAESKKYCGDIPGLACKNLFLRNQKKTRFFLVTLPAEKRMDLQKLSDIAKTDKLSFASEKDLMEMLGITPGSVSPFGLINKNSAHVEFYIDKEVHEADIVGFHPNDNTATLELKNKMFLKFLSAVGCTANIIEL